MPQQRGRRVSGSWAWRACAVAASVATIAIVSGVARVEAHKPVTSPYDYNNNVFPLLREQCGRCHADNGAAPMSLMTYKDAVPWAESIRDELTAGRMPPWPLDARSPAVRGGHRINVKELDEIVVWASGGTPHAWTGDPNRPLPPVTVKVGWTLGPPDLAIPMPSPHVMASGSLDEIADVMLKAGNDDAKWIRAADLLPGTPSAVRDAIISVDNGPTLRVWQPGFGPVAAPEGTAFALPPHATIHLKIHYKKHYDQEQASVSDRSTVGLYFTPAPPSAHGIATTTLGPASASSTDGSESLTGAVAAAGRIVAITPFLDKPYGALDVVAVKADGTSVPLLKLNAPRPQWFYRYWLDKPVDVEAGATLQVKASSLPGYDDDLQAKPRFLFRVDVDCAPR